MDGINSGSCYHCLTSRDISLIRRGTLYSSCVQSSMLHGSETWPVRKDKKAASHRVAWSVALSVCHTDEPCKNGCNDQVAIWVQDSGEPNEPRIT